jgi:hypothetical protein
MKERNPVRMVGVREQIPSGQLANAGRKYYLSNPSSDFSKLASSFLLVPCFFYL